MTNKALRFSGFLGVLLLHCFTGAAQKDTIATYYGGHGCIDKTLYLFSDSTFYFEERSALFIPTSSKKKGAYLFSDSTITLYAFKKLKFIKFKPENKYRENEFRVRNGDILMYSEEAEHGKDSNFIRDYNTMRLVRSRFTR
jgi:hypothetical protein